MVSSVVELHASLDFCSVVVSCPGLASVVLFLNLRCSHWKTKGNSQTKHHFGEDHHLSEFSLVQKIASFLASRLAN